MIPPPRMYLKSSTVEFYKACCAGVFPYGRRPRPGCARSRQPWCAPHGCVGRSRISGGCFHSASLASEPRPTSGKEGLGPVLIGQRPIMRPGSGDGALRSTAAYTSRSYPSRALCTPTTVTATATPRAQQNDGGKVGSSDMLDAHTQHRDARFSRRASVASHH